MNRILMAFTVTALVASLANAQSASERADKHLAELLLPSAGKTAPFAERPRQWKSPRLMEEFTLAIVPYAGPPARLPQMRGKDVKPRPAPEALPLVAYREETEVPEQAPMPTKPLIKVPSIDLNAPLPIPTLAQPLKDRASLADPAFAASLSAAMKTVTPTRDKPVPFTPLNLPDPFENVRYGQLRSPPEESATPPVIPIVRPQ